MTINYLTATINDLANDAKVRGSEATAFLKELVCSTKTNKHGEKKPLSFIAIKRAYFKKYLPELLPQAKPKAPTMKEIVLAL